MNEQDELKLSPAEIVAQALGQLAEFIQESNEKGAFEEENAHNNALLASMACVGLVPNLIRGDYIEAQKCLAEIMGPLFDAVGVPRHEQPGFAAGMVGRIIEEKKPQIVKAAPMEVSQFGKSLQANGKGRKRRR